MKRNQLNEYRKKELSELNAEVLKKQKEAKFAKINMYVGREKNLKTHSLLRHEIAQILGIIREVKKTEVKEETQVKKVEEVKTVEKKGNKKS